MTRRGYPTSTLPKHRDTRRQPDTAIKDSDQPGTQRRQAPDHNGPPSEDNRRTTSNQELSLKFRQFTRTTRKPCNSSRCCRSCSASNARCVTRTCPRSSSDDIESTPGTTSTRPYFSLPSYSTTTPESLKRKSTRPTKTPLRSTTSACNQGTGHPAHHNT